MKRKLLSGTFHYLATEQEMIDLAKRPYDGHYRTIEKCWWEGPQTYLLLESLHNLPCGCCNENVREIITLECAKDEAITEIDKWQKFGAECFARILADQIMANKD